MKIRTASHHSFSFLYRRWILLLILPVEALYAQAPVPQVGNVASTLAQLTSTFSGARTIQSIQLSGDATWYAGSLEDSGTVNLNAASDGSSQMQLDLSATGQLTESQSGIGSSAKCQRSGKDGVVHSVDRGNCWRPVLWFLPTFSLQPKVLSNQQVFTDLGQGTVGSGEAVYHHLQGQVVPSGAGPTGSAAASLAERSSTDIGLDPATSLPSVLTYSLRPDDGVAISIPVEVRFSEYRSVDGVQIPFHIERYLNGSLQLDIRVSAAVIH